MNQEETMQEEWLGLSVSTQNDADYPRIEQMAPPSFFPLHKDSVAALLTVYTKKWEKQTIKQN